MSVELRPLGVRCNLHCHYCYQNPQRDAGGAGTRYSISKMKEAVERAGGPFTLFGGEPLLVPIADLEALWAWGFARFGRNSVQTNGSLITDAHIALFQKYRVHVGISLDGPGELNALRWNGSDALTQRATEKSEAAIEALLSAGTVPSLIITLSRTNAVGDRLRRLEEWIRYLDQRGVTNARLHILEAESEWIQRQHGLTAQENTRAFTHFARIESSLKTLRFDLFDDMRRLLVGDDRNVTCVWTGCDPYTTRAVQGIEGNGQRSNCGRTNKDGVDFVKADSEGFERYVALHQTPQRDGGCASCRFFIMCKGQCPGTSIDGDWRNRSSHCQTWKALFRVLEDDLKREGTTPLSRRPSTRERVEREMVDGWMRGENLTIWKILASTPAEEG